MTQGDLFDADTGELLRDRGTGRVLSNNEKYRQRFFEAGRHFLAKHGEVTTDEIVLLIGMPDGHPNAVGASMRALAKADKLSVKTYRKSTRPSCHAAIIAVWTK